LCGNCSRQLLCYTIRPPVSSPCMQYNYVEHVHMFDSYGHGGKLHAYAGAGLQPLQVAA
jgi:hypothetical protein